MIISTTVYKDRNTVEPGLQLVDPTTAGGVQPLGLTGYTLQFSDEFSGGSLDALKWDTHYPNWDIFNVQDPGGNTTNTNNSCSNQPGQVSVASSNVVLKAEHTTTIAGLPYTSGMIQSLKSYAISPGSFVEASFKLSDVHDVIWPAFWASNSATNQWPPEVDVMEHFGTGSGVLMNIFYGTGTEESNAFTVDTLLNYHTYGAKWNTNGLFDFYIDGVKRSSSTHAMSGSMYLILDLATRINIGTVPASPITMSIDYVRAWT